MATTIILEYTGNQKSVKRTGKISKIKYSFGSSKKQFWADPRDVDGLMKTSIGDYLLVK